MKQTTTLLNPYSVRMEKKPFMEVEGKPVFTLGDFRIYKYYHNHYVHTFKNIVVAERGAPNKEVLSNLAGITKPVNEVDLYHDFERPNQAMKEGIKEAKKLNFKIN